MTSATIFRHILEERLTAFLFVLRLFDCVLGDLTHGKKALP
jgi:hypothetical protein